MVVKSVMRITQSKFVSVLFALACVFTVIYMGLGIYNQIRPKSNNEKAMECLKLPTNDSVVACLHLQLKDK
jgi:hypothetical protein